MEKQEQIQPQKNSKEEQTFQSNLNSAYTFDKLTRSPSNKFVYKVAEMTAHNFGARENNPLIIHSSPGLGKTHLLHAIGNEILKNNPSTKVLYISGEDFFKEYIENLQGKEVANFRERFRTLDCLLMDDIQFFDNKQATILEFLFVVKSLLENNKQIVLSVDRHPLQLGWGESISARLTSGLIVEITRPNLETRMAILRQKRNSIGFDIGDEVLAFIAENIKTNICDLEGALFRLVSYSRVNGIKPTIEIAKELAVYISTPNKINGNTNITD